MKFNEQDNEINNINSKVENEENKRNVFNIIIGVSTLLIAILGATFAYFSATATSKENDVNVKSAYVNINKNQINIILPIFYHSKKITQCQKWDLSQKIKIFSN